MREVPEHLILFLTVNNGSLHWVSEAERDAAPWPVLEMKRCKRKVLPFGKPVGSRRVHGHGSLFTLSGHYLLTCDALAAIADGGRWPWELSDTVPHVPGGDDSAALAAIHKTWKLEGGAIVWAVTVGDGNEAGMVARGMELSGPRGSMLTRSGVGYLASDVKHALVNNYFPWGLDV